MSRQALAFTSPRLFSAQSSRLGCCGSGPCLSTAQHRRRPRRPPTLHFLLRPLANLVLFLFRSSINTLPCPFWRSAYRPHCRQAGLALALRVHQTERLRHGEVSLAPTPTCPCLTRHTRNARSPPLPNVRRDDTFFVAASHRHLYCLTLYTTISLCLPCPVLPFNPALRRACQNRPLVPRPAVTVTQPSIR